jgi:ATP-dependent helicase HrpB
MIELPNNKQELLAWQELQQLGLVNTQNQLSQRGMRAAEYAAHPRFANMVEHARDLSKEQKIEHLISLACVMSALLEERDIFSKEQSQFNCDISHRVMALLTQPNHRRHQHIIQQAKRLYSQVKQPHLNESFCYNHGQLPLKYCGVLLALAYPERLAKQRNSTGEYLTANGKGLYLHEQDAIANQPYIVAARIYTSRERLCISSAAAVDMTVLLAWEIVKPLSNNRLHYCNKQKRIVAANEQTIGAIIIAEKNATDISAQLIVNCWLKQIKKMGLSWLNFQKKDLDLLTRWRWVNRTQPHLAFIDVTEVALLAQIDAWLAPFLGNVRTKAQLDKLNYSEILLAQLNYVQQQQLNKYAASFFIGPTGRKCPIRYREEQGPIVSLPMQELYGVSETPVVGDRQNGAEQPLVIEILSPAQRPIQVTQDLVSFWRGSYKEVQKEMKSSYPKHYWPDDPANAQATRKTKKHIKS